MVPQNLVAEATQNYNKAPKRSRYKPGTSLGSLYIIDYHGCNYNGKPMGKDAFVTVYCKNCGMIETICVSKFRHFNGSNIACTHCLGDKKKKSSNESIICELLDKLGVFYAREKTVYDCKNPRTGRALRFDFWIPAYNCFIEAHGSQHFHEWGLSSDSLEERKYRDRVKEDYCKKHGYKLLLFNSQFISELDAVTLKKKLEG